MCGKDLVMLAFCNACEVHVLSVGKGPGGRPPHSSYQWSAGSRDEKHPLKYTSNVHALAHWRFKERSTRSEIGPAGFDTRQDTIMRWGMTKKLNFANSDDPTRFGTAGGHHSVKDCFSSPKSLGAFIISAPRASSRKTQAGRRRTTWPP